MAGMAEIAIIVSASTSIAQGALRDLASSITGMSGIAKTAFIGMAVAAGTVAIAFGENAVKAAEEAQQSTARLSIALRNVGIDYAKYGEVINYQLQAISKNTVNTNEQTQMAFARLIGITGDYQKSLEFLGLAQDLAAFKNTDVVSSADLVARAIMGNTRLFAQYRIKIDETLTPMQALIQLQKQMAGTAEALKTPQSEFSKNWNEFATDVGNTILPALNAVISGINYLSNQQQKYDEAMKSSYLTEYEKNFLRVDDAIALVNQRMAEAEGSINSTTEAINKQTHALGELVTSWTGTQFQLTSGGWAPVPGQYATPPPTAGSVTPMYSSPPSGAGGNVQINNYIQGSVISERDQTSLMRRQLYITKTRNTNLGLA